MPLYDMADIIDKTLVAQQQLNVYDSPDGNIIGTVEPGEPAGVVYSWVTGAGGTIWFMFESNDSNMVNELGSYYIPNLPNSFSIDALQQQGVISTHQKVIDQQKANQSTFDKIANLVKWVGIAFIIGTVGKSLVDKVNIHKKAK